MSRKKVFYQKGEYIFFVSGTITTNDYDELMPVVDDILDSFELND